MWARRPADGGDGGRPPAPRTADDVVIAEILGDVRELRLHLAADLSAAAGAVDEGEPSVAADFVAADEAMIDEFVRRARACLDEAADRPTSDPLDVSGTHAARRRGRGLIPVAPALAAAAALALVVSSVLPSHVSGHGGFAARPVSESWQRFSYLARSDATADQVIAAADQLHDSLADLIAQAGHDPAKARQALQLLELERQLVLNDHPAGAAVVLAQSQALVAQLAAMLPGTLSPSAIRHRRPAVTPVVVDASAAPSPAPSPSGKPADAQPTAAAAPAPSATKSSPTASPAPSPSPSDINPLPTPPTFPH